MTAYSKVFDFSSKQGFRFAAYIRNIVPGPTKPKMKWKKQKNRAVAGPMGIRVDCAYREIARSSGQNETRGDDGGASQNSRKQHSQGSIKMQTKHGGESADSGKQVREPRGGCVVSLLPAGVAKNAGERYKEATRRPYEQKRQKYSYLDANKEKAGWGWTKREREEPCACVCVHPCFILFSLSLREYPPSSGTPCNDLSLSASFPRTFSACTVAREEEGRRQGC